MPDEDKILTRPEGEQPLDREVVDVTEEIHIPKYARLDFGFPKGGRYSLDALYPREA